MKKAFKVTCKFSGTCEFWFDGNEIKTKEDAKKEAMKKLYSGEIGQYFNPIDIDVKDVEESQIMDEYYTN